MNMPYIFFHEEYEKIVKDTGFPDLNQSPIFVNWDFCLMKYPSAIRIIIKRILNEFSFNQVAVLIFSLLKGKDGSLTTIPVFRS